MKWYICVDYSYWEICKKEVKPKIDFKLAALRDWHEDRKEYKEILKHLVKKSI